MAIRYPVEVTARYSNPMSFRVPGKLIERKVRIGDTVKKGEVVAQLDPLDAQKQAASAKAALGLPSIVCCSRNSSSIATTLSRTKT